MRTSDNEEKTIFLLYGGSSADGRGSGRYIGRTEDKEKAKKHYLKVYNDPYSTGQVKILSKGEETVAGYWTDWASL